MERLETIKKALDDAEAQYKLLYHEAPILSVEEGKKHFPPEQIAYTLVITVDGVYHALIVAGERGRVDFAALKQALGCQKAKLADAAQVLDRTGFSVGNMPLVGLPLPYLMDQRLAGQRVVCGGSGDESHTLQIAVEDLVRGICPTWVSF